MTTGTLGHNYQIALRLIGNDVKEGVRKHLANPVWSTRLLQGGGLFLAFAFFVLLHAGAIAVIKFIAYTTQSAEAVSGVSVLIWMFLIFVMLSGGLVRALVVLHEQDDSNLLLSAPVWPRTILGARLFGNALQSCLIDGFIILPWIDAFILLGHPFYFCGYLVWLCLAILVTCCDALLSFGLVRIWGLRRARSISQVVPFVLVFGLTLVSLQAGLAATNTRLFQDNQGAALPPELRDHLIDLGQSFLAQIPRASSGHPAPFFALIFVTLAVAWLTLSWTEKPFLAGSQQVQEGDSRTVSMRPSPPFRRQVLLLEISKSLRLVVRTPMILVQAFSQILTPIGLAFVLAQVNLAEAVTFFMIFSTGVLTGILTIATGTVETCDELLRMSPQGELRFRLGKMMAGAVFPIAVALLVLAGLLATRQWHYAAALFFAGLPLTVVSALVSETFADPLPQGVKPKLLSSPIMIIPLLGTQILSGVVAGLCALAAGWSWLFLGLSCLACYLFLLLALGLAQLRKPLL